MSALKIHVDDDYIKEYSLIGLSCHLKDYRLIYSINKALNCDFKKYDDLVIFPVKGKKKNSFSFYSFQEDFIEYYIISNRNANGMLIPEQKQIDYIFVLRGQIDKHKEMLILNSLLKIPALLTAFKIRVDTVRNLDVILSDLELHQLKISKENKA
jgi:hypothetical protein